MRRRAKIWFTLLASTVAAQDLSRELPGVVADIRTPPVAVRSGGQYLLQYELHLANWESKAVTVQAVEVLGPERLLLLEGQTLGKAFATGFENKEVLPGEKSTAVLIAFSVDRVPELLSHRIRIQKAGDTAPLTIDYRGTPVSVNKLRIRAPLSGDRWLVANGPAGNNHHTGSFMPFEGRIRVPQRFAIDFVQLQEDGQTHHGDAKDNRNYRCYGAEALAVAAARVADVRDGIPENRPDPNERAVKMTLDTVSGNHVVLDLGGGRFAHYAHLQPGSIRVHTGDRVRPGQVLGLVGNSGNSTEPHLHFQISDGPGILQSDGLPYAIDAFVREGEAVCDELPRDGWKVDFAHAAGR